MNKIDDPNIKTQLLSLLDKTRQAVSIDYVRYHLNIQWNTARALLLTLALEGKICSQKTTKSWIFWVEKNGENQP